MHVFRAAYLVWRTLRQYTGSPSTDTSPESEPDDVEDFLAISYLPVGKPNKESFTERYTAHQLELMGAGGCPPILYIK